MISVLHTKDPQADLQEQFHRHKCLNKDEGKA
jgi:hypothetical protein